MLVLGFALAMRTVPAHLQGFTVLLLGGIWAWRCWQRASLERAESWDCGQVTRDCPGSGCNA